MLIDEQERNFRRGIIVNAIITKVFDDFIVCTLDNQLGGKCSRKDLEIDNM